jgi:hypothetical protein
MRIINNSTVYETRALRTIICLTHWHMKKLMGKPAPNWNRLEVKIGNTKRTGYHSGHAFYGGRSSYIGQADVFFGLCKPEASMTMTNHTFCHLVYHELMHTYGFRHSQYSDIPKREILKLFPIETDLPIANAPLKKKELVWTKRYNSALAREKAWTTKLKRAKTALKKAQDQRKYYEKKYMSD